MKRWGLIGAGYAALLLLVFHRVFLERMYFGWDCLREYWPDLLVPVRAIAAGDAPLWNPYALGGYPYWGDPQAGLLAPVSWLCWLSSWLTGSQGAWLIQLKVLLNLWIGLAGMHALGLRRTGSHAAAFVGAVVFVLGSPLLVHKNGAYLWPFLYLPLAVLALERFLDSPRLARAAQLALAVFLCAGAGHPQAFFYDLIVFFAYWAYRAAARPDTIRAQVSGAAVFAGLTLLLVLPIYLPAAQAVAASPRSHRGLAYVLQQPLLPQNLRELLLPNLDDDWMQDVYVSIVALVAGVYAVVAARERAVRRQRIFWWALGAFGLILAMGAHAKVLPFLAAHVPGFGLFRIAYRHKLIFGFAIAVLAADGVGELVRGEASRGARRTLAGLSALWVAGAALAAPFAGRHQKAVVFALVTAGPALAALCAAAWRPGRARLLAAGAAALVAADLWLAGLGKIDILQPAPDLAHDAPTLARMPGAQSAWRYQSDPALVPYHVPYAHDVRELSGFLNPIQNARQERVEASLSPPLLARLNVRWWWHQGRVLELPDAVPLGRVYPRAELVPDGEAALARLGVPPADAAIVEQADRPAAALPAGAFPPADARLVSYRRNAVSLEVDAPGTGILVVAETFFPGWRAEVNGAAATIFRADYLNRAVVVPAGVSRVTFRYAPPSLLPLAVAFVLGLLGAVGLSSVSAWRRSSS